MFAAVSGAIPTVHDTQHGSEMSFWHAAHHAETCEIALDSVSVQTGNRGGVPRNVRASNGSIRDATVATETRSPIVQRVLGILFSDPIIIGGLTVLGYLMAFSFVSGEADALGIPPALITVSLENILTALISLLAFLGLISMVVDMFMSNMSRRVLDSTLFSPIANTIALAIISGLGGLLVSPLSYLFEVFPVIFLCILLIAPLYYRTYGDTYLERLIKIAEAREKFRRDPERRPWLLKRIGAGPVWVMGAVIASIVISTEVGRAKASFQTHYFVSLTQPREVLLARYGDVLVFRRGNSPAVVIRVIGKDGIPQLAKVRTGSMAIAANP